MAEGLLKHYLMQLDKKDYEVYSAGLSALVGRHPDSSACQLMSSKEIDISDYRASQLNKDMVRKADLILVMESAQKFAIEDFDPSAKGKVFRLGHWGDFDIPDPYQQDITVFENSLNLIDQGISEWLKRL